jgi:hypothetical protein
VTSFDILSNSPSISIFRQLLSFSTVKDGGLRFVFSAGCKAEVLSSSIVCPLMLAALCLAGRLANPQELVEAQLGPLATFEVVDASSVSLQAGKECDLNAGKNCEVFLPSGKNQAA